MMSDTTTCKRANDANRNRILGSNLKPGGIMGSVNNGGALLSAWRLSLSLGCCLFACVPVLAQHQQWTTTQTDDTWIDLGTVNFTVSADVKTFDWYAQTTQYNHIQKMWFGIYSGGTVLHQQAANIDYGPNASNFNYYNEQTVNGRCFGRLFDIQTGGWGHFKGINLDDSGYDYVNDWQQGDYVTLHMQVFTNSTHSTSVGYQYTIVLADPNAPVQDPNYCDEIIPKHSYAQGFAVSFGALEYTGPTNGGADYRYRITVDNPLPIRWVDLSGGTNISDVDWTIAPTGESAQTTTAYGTQNVAPRPFTSCIPYDVIEAGSTTTFFFTVAGDSVTDPATGQGFNFTITAPFATCDFDGNDEYTECDSSIGNVFTHDGGQVDPDPDT